MKKRENLVKPEKKPKKKKSESDNVKLEYIPEKDNQPGNWCEVSGVKNCKCKYCK